MENEQLFIHGFNSGYILAKYEPQIADNLVRVEGIQDEYFSGLLSGRSEYQLEKAKEKLKSLDKHTNRHRSRNKSK